MTEQQIPAPVVNNSYTPPPVPAASVDPNPAWQHLRKAPSFRVKAIGAAATAVFIGLAGFGIGTATHGTPKECSQALDYSEQALNLSSKAMGIIADSLGNEYAMAGVSSQLSPITAQLNDLSPKYKDAKSACLK